MELEIYAEEKIKGDNEREKMKSFIEKWERILDHVHDAMGREAIMNRWKIDKNFGGVHFSSNDKVMPTNIELKLML